MRITKPPVCMCACVRARASACVRACMCAHTAGSTRRIMHAKINMNMDMDMDIYILYNNQVEGVVNGTYDYTLLKGDTGPLVYPAGFV